MNYVHAQTKNRRCGGTVMNPLYDLYRMLVFRYGLLSKKFTGGMELGLPKNMAISMVKKNG